MRTTLNVLEYVVGYALAAVIVVVLFGVVNGFVGWDLVLWPITWPF